MEGERREKLDIQDSLVLEEGMILKFPSVYFTTFVAPGFKILSSKKKLNDLIVEMHKEPKS